MGQTTGQTTGPISWSDLLAQETKRDPAAFFAQMRAQAPLYHFTDFFGMGGEAWIATSYDDAALILRDPRFIKDAHKVTPSGDRPSATHQLPPRAEVFAWRRDMLTTDPPDHTRLRNLVSKAFTPRVIELLRPRIQQIADGLLDGTQDRGHMDLIGEFAFPLPITVICELLGIPVEERKQFRTWTQTLLIETATASAPEGPDEQAARVAAAEAFTHYIKTLLAEKRAHPGSDLTSQLVQAEDQGDALSEVELMSTIFLLIVAGHETTVNLIGNGMLVLLQHPDQLRLLRQDPSLLPSAVEELLRYTGPVSLATPRWASEDITLHGQVIRQGEMVLVALIGANTDPQQFHDPDLLDLTRAEHEHLAFGKGIHYCLGAPLARLEGQIAIGTLLRRLPDLRLASDPEQLVWTRTPILRGLTSLPVAF